MKIGKKVLLRIRRKPEQTYTSIYIGPHAVKLKDEEDSIQILKRRR